MVRPLLRLASRGVRQHLVARQAWSCLGRRAWCRGVVTLTDKEKADLTPEQLKHYEDSIEKELMSEPEDSIIDTLAASEDFDTPTKSAAELEAEYDEKMAGMGAHQAQEEQDIQAELEKAPWCSEHLKPFNAPFGEKGVGGGRSMLEGIDLRWNTNETLDALGNPFTPPWKQEGDSEEETARKMKAFFPEHEWVLADVMHRLKQIPDKGKIKAEWDTDPDGGVECSPDMAPDDLWEALMHTEGSDWFPEIDFVKGAEEAVGEGAMPMVKALWGPVQWRQPQLDAFHADGVFIPRVRFSAPNVRKLQLMCDQATAATLDACSERHIFRRDKRFFEFGMAPEVFMPLRQLLGPDIMMLDMDLIGQKAGAPAVAWHQEMHGWPLVPSGDQLKVVTVVIHIDDGDVESGCMRVSTGTKTEYLPWTKDEASGRCFVDDAESLDANSADVRVEPGMLLFHDMYTPIAFHANTTGQDRRALVCRYMSTSDLFDRELAKEKATEGWEDLSMHKLHLVSGFDQDDKHKNPRSQSDWEA